MKKIMKVLRHDWLLLAALAFALFLSAEALAGERIPPGTAVSLAWLAVVLVARL